MKNKIKTSMYILLILLFSISVNAHIKQSPLNPRNIPESFEEAESLICDNPDNGFMWDSKHTYYIATESCDGLFLGVVNALTPELRTFEGSKIWGIYRDGAWISLLNNASSENIIFGNYGDINMKGREEIVWDSFTPTGGYTGVFGFGNNVFT